jgi:hypothetical protein
MAEKQRRHPDGIKSVQGAFLSFSIKEVFVGHAHGVIGASEKTVN